MTSLFASAIFHVREGMLKDGVYSMFRVICNLEYVWQQSYQHLKRYERKFSQYSVFIVTIRSANCIEQHVRVTHICDPKETISSDTFVKNCASEYL